LGKRSAPKVAGDQHKRARRSIENNTRGVGSKNKRDSKSKRGAHDGYNKRELRSGRE